MTRDELITAVRAQTDVDEEDLPLATASMYLREAFQRTAALDRHWPSCEADWDYTIADGDNSTLLDAATAEIGSVTLDDGARLSVADHQLIKSATGLYGVPAFFSLWGGRLFVWAHPGEETMVHVSGWRVPSTDWLSDPAQQVDLDDRLHLSVFHYAVSLVYAQLEDYEGEANYMRRWEMGTDAVKKDILKSGSYRPIVLNGGLLQQQF